MPHDPDAGSSSAIRDLWATRTFRSAGERAFAILRT